MRTGDPRVQILGSADLAAGPNLRRRLRLEALHQLCRSASRTWAASLSSVRSAPAFRSLPSNSSASRRALMRKTSLPAGPLRAPRPGLP